MNLTTIRGSLRARLGCVLFVAALGIAGASSVLAAGPDVTRIKGTQAKTLLGDGTGIVIGVIDSGVDDLHPALTGNVTGGLPRMIAEANFVTTEPGNTGDDVFGHGTAVMGVIGSRDTTFFGVATDARYINARVLDSNNSFATDAWVVNGVGFALNNGANLINMSLGYGNANTSGLTKLALMSDYISSQRRIPVVVSAGNNGTTANPKPQGPGDAYNVFSVAATQASTYNQIVNFSSYGPTTDGRVKPDISAPGQSINTANDDWETQADYEQWSGTSFAAPNTAAILAAQMEYGNANGLSIDPLVLKATLLNSAEKIRDRTNAAWEPNASSLNAGVLTVTSPLDSQSGAGQVDGLKLYQQYSAGEFAPGNVPAVGWDLNTITGTNSLDYNLGTLLQNSTFSATLTWYRKVGWTDDGDGIIDSADTFAVTETLDNLNLSLLLNNVEVARSISSVDNLEHLYFSSLAAGNYTLRVTRLSGGGTNEEYGLAWATVVPEPGTIALVACVAFGLVGRAYKRRQQAMQIECRAAL